MKKKVGLATCFIDNYGACLQAYALSRKIKECGCKCQIINYIEPHNYNKPSLRNTLYSHSLIAKILTLRYKHIYIAHGKKPAFHKFRRKYLSFTRRFLTAKAVKDANLRFDACVCGSDQIWNPLFFNGNNDIYFLDFVSEGTKRIAYAPSIGLAEFPEEYMSDLKEKVNRFDYLSVRETAGQKIVAPLTDNDVKVVLDPTLLLTASQWAKIAKLPKIKEPYIFLYLFGNRPYIGEFVEYVRNLTGLQVVCIPYTEREKNPEYVKVYDAGPCEFLGLIKNASLVITDSFHATAFSINFNIPFYSLLRNEDSEKINMNSRIFSILDLVGLQERLVNPDVEYPFNIDMNVDFTEANRRIDEKRTIDFGDLKYHLEGTDNGNLR